MKWDKLGLVNFSNDRASVPQATLPIPMRISDRLLRIYFSRQDENGRSLPYFVDVDAHNPTTVVYEHKTPLLDVGAPGAFDDNGVVPVSIIQPEPNTFYMYYVGFELCSQIRYRLFTGLAISKDHGKTFHRYSKTPILDRSDAELYFRCGPFVMLDEGKFKMWYIAGSEWTVVNDKSVPVYDLRYQESSDGIQWAPQGTVVMQITETDEHGFGRPWIVKRSADDYQLYYSIRHRSLSAYRLGYAESLNGLQWLRKDNELGLTISPDGFDSEAMMYSAVITVDQQTYCFYNGNNFGQDGFAVAKLREHS